MLRFKFINTFVLYTLQVGHFPFTHVEFIDDGSTATDEDAGGNVS